MSTDKLKTGDQQPYVTAEPGDIFWRYSEPPHRGAKLILLTIGGSLVTGQWTGEVGEAFLAWSPMIKRDHNKEREIMERISQRNREKRDRMDARLAAKAQHDGD